LLLLLLLLRRRHRGPAFLRQGRGEGTSTPNGDGDSSSSSVLLMLLLPAEIADQIPRRAVRARLRPVGRVRQIRRAVVVDDGSLGGLRPGVLLDVLLVCFAVAVGLRQGGGAR